MTTPQTATDTLQDRMIQMPIGKLILKLATPTIASMLVSSIYNMADTYFVSQIGQSAAGAVGVVFTLMTLIQAIGFTLGVGCGSSIARLLGAQEAQEASKIASTGFFCSLLFGVVFSVISFIFINPLMYLLGATETIAPHAREYASYILIGAPYMAASFVLNNILRSQGNAFWAMIGLTAGGFINIALDPLFIFYFEMGTGGAALATIISQLISFSILFYMVMHHGQVRLSFRLVKMKLLRIIIPVGAPSFYRQGMASIATILLNHASGAYGDAAIAAMSIVMRIMSFCFSALIGFFQGFQPVCGYNYSAKRYDRVREAILFSLKTAVITLSIMAVIVIISARPLMGLFRKGDIEVIEIGALALRLQALMLPSIAIATMANMAYQSLGMASKASLLSLARQGLFFIPLILILPGISGLLGVQLAQPIADLCTMLLAIPFSVQLLRDLSNMDIRHAA